MKRLWQNILRIHNSEPWLGHYLFPNQFLTIQITRRLTNTVQRSQRKKPVHFILSYLIKRIKHRQRLHYQTTVATPLLVVPKPKTFANICTHDSVPETTNVVSGRELRILSAPKKKFNGHSLRVICWRCSNCKLKFLARWDIHILSRISVGLFHKVFDSTSVK